MRAWPAHLIFAMVLVGSLAAKDRASEALAESNDLEPAVMSVARANGLAFRGYTTIAGTDIRALDFRAVGCPQSVLIVVLSVTLDQDAVLRAASEPSYVLRYVYIDRSWERPHRLAIFIARMKYAILALFRLTHYVPSWRLLLIESPRDCPIVDGIDWRVVWNRDYLTANPAEVTTR
jgi:hypothetical protein